MVRRAKRFTPNDVINKYFITFGTHSHRSHIKSRHERLRHRTRALNAYSIALKANCCDCDCDCNTKNSNGVQNMCGMAIEFCCLAIFHSLFIFTRISIWCVCAGTLIFNIRELLIHWHTVNGMKPHIG